METSLWPKKVEKLEMLPEDESALGRLRDDLFRLLELRDKDRLEEVDSSSMMQNSDDAASLDRVGNADVSMERRGFSNGAQLPTRKSIRCATY